MDKTIATILGVVFLVIGLLGLFPNSIVGDGAYFQADLWHNLVHLVTGLIFLLVVSRSPGKSASTLTILGVIYLVIAILGFFVGEGAILGFIGVNGADNWLHLVIGVVALIAGLSTKGSSSQ